MYAVCVHVRVKAEHAEAFLQATLDNARHTVQEPGNLRFDVMREQEDPTRFLLFEVYKDEAGMAAHKETAHYAAWRDAVGDWMAEKRYGVKYDTLFPESEDAWAAV